MIVQVKLGINTADNTAVYEGVLDGKKLDRIELAFWLAKFSASLIADAIQETGRRIVVPPNGAFSRGNS